MTNINFYFFVSSLKPILEKSAKKKDLEILKLELEIQNLKKNT